MVHGVEKLVLVCKVSDNEINQAKGENEDSELENTIDNADYVYEDWLREVEAVLEHGRFYELRIIY